MPPLDTEEKNLFPDELVAELRAKHGAIHQLETTTGEKAVFKRPSRLVFRRFVQKSEESQYDATERLVLDCLVHPAADEFNKMLDERPGALFTFGNDLVKAAGLAKGSAKKVG